MRVETPEGPKVLTLASALTTRLWRSRLREAETVDYVGDLDKYIVLRASGSTVLMSARPGYTRRSQRRLERTFTE